MKEANLPHKVGGSHEKKAKREFVLIGRMNRIQDSSFENDLLVTKK